MAMGRPRAITIDGNKLRVARMERSLNQDKVAERAGCNVRTLRNAELNGKCEPNTLADILQAMNELNNERPNRCERLTTEDFIVTLGTDVEPLAPACSSLETAKHSLPRLDISHLPATAEHFVGREEDLDWLNHAWNDPKTSVVELVAFGGVGKSTLIAAWLEEMMVRGWSGAKRIFGHSFYSQGSKADSNASSEEFLNDALTFFGDEYPHRGNSWQRGQRLAQLAASEKTLMILDGLEPLQEPGPSTTAGRIRDPGLASLISTLAAGMNGLLVITTRVSVSGLSGYHQQKVLRRELTSLSGNEGVTLLRALGVHGSEQQLHDAVADFEGHALILTLVGTFLKYTGRLDIQQRFSLNLLDVERTVAPSAKNHFPLNKSAMTFTRVMQRYELWLSGQLGDTHVPEFGREVALELLELTGLFDRPITAGEFGALIRNSDAELFPAAARADDDTLNLVINRLVDYRLLRTVGISRISTDLAQMSQIDRRRPIIDTHPMIREFYGARMQEHSGTQWEERGRRGHNCLFRYLTDSAPIDPRNLVDLIPLYRAVAHGCKAGLYGHAFTDVLQARIRRNSSFFSTDQLGAYGLEKTALFHFFEGSWSRPNPGLDPQQQFEVSMSAGYVLRSLGEIESAIAPLMFAVGCAVKDYRELARAASLLASALLTNGKIAEAIYYAEMGVAMARQSGEPDAVLLRMASLGEVLHWAGEEDRAEEILQLSEKMRRECPTSYNRNSLGRHNLGELLLDQGRFLEVSGILLDPENDEQNLRTQTKALNQIVAARSKVLAGLQNRRSVRKDILELDDAVASLRELFAIEYLCRHLIFRAYYRIEDIRNRRVSLRPVDAESIERDLSEAEEYIVIGGLNTLRVDLHLVKARYSMVQGCKESAITYLGFSEQYQSETVGEYRAYDTPHWDPPESVSAFPFRASVAYHRRDTAIRQTREWIGE